MKGKEATEAYQVGRMPMKIGDKEYQPGDIIPSIGDVSGYVLRQLVDSARIRKILVVTPAKFKQLMKEAG